MAVPAPVSVSSHPCYFWIKADPAFDSTAVTVLDWQVGTHSRGTTVSAGQGGEDTGGAGEVTTRQRDPHVGDTCTPERPSGRPGSHGDGGSGNPGTRDPVPIQWTRLLPRQSPPRSGPVAPTAPAYGLADVSWETGRESRAGRRLRARESRFARRGFSTLPGAALPSVSEALSGARPSRRRPRTCPGTRLGASARPLSGRTPLRGGSSTGTSVRFTDVSEVRTVSRVQASLLQTLQKPRSRGTRRGRAFPVRRVPTHREAAIAKGILSTL